MSMLVNVAYNYLLTIWETNANTRSRMKYEAVRGGFVKPLAAMVLCEPPCSTGSSRSREGFVGPQTKALAGQVTNYFWVILRAGRSSSCTELPRTAITTIRKDSWIVYNVFFW